MKIETIYKEIITNRLSEQELARFLILDGITNEIDILASNDEIFIECENYRDEILICLSKCKFLKFEL